MVKDMKLCMSILICVCLCLVGPARAVSVIRDSETEAGLLGLVRPIFQAAGLDPENAQVVIINDPSINAFVAGGQTIFVHSGLIMQSDAVDDVAFVLAHETGHIVGGHIVRGYQALQNAQTTALISTVLGGVLAVAGGRPDAGIAIMMGGQTSVMGAFTKYRQTEESAADRIAVDIMHKTGYSMQGFEHTMKRLMAMERLNSAPEGNSYLQTHPMTQTRVSDLSRFLTAAKPVKKDETFDLMKAKLTAFLDKPEAVLRAWPGKTNPDLYAQAVALYRLNRFDEAFERLDTLMKRAPNNPYFPELKGQLLFETGRLEPAEEAYAKAYRLKPDAPLIQLSYAQVLLERGDRARAETAEGLLLYITQHEPDTPLVWQLLAKAYDRQGKSVAAQYAMAEYERSLGHIAAAKKRAEKVKKELPAGSVLYQKVQDILAIEEAPKS